MSLREKIQLCRNIFETSGIGDDEDKWLSIVSAVLGPEGKKGVVKLLVKLATLDHDSYQMLHQMLTLHSNGKLKGQKLSPVDIANGPDLRPYTFVGLPELRPSAIQRVLFEVRDNVMSVSEMQEVKLLHKLLRVQRFFVDLVGATSWDMMLRLVFLGETTREVLKHFCKCNLRSTLGELKTFCRQLQREEDMKFDGFQGADGAIGTLLNCDVALFEAQMLEDIPVFSGSSLIILDMPEVKN
ncbi:uncharacterized protein [Apostichopus japonicus]|uniref:uncharacterized protein n=1 Tax=Stichopus japonicus TaxID=307972 RepID=UPI003AB274FE